MFDAESIIRAQRPPGKHRAGLMATLREIRELPETFRVGQTVRILVRPVEDDDPPHGSIGRIAFYARPLGFCFEVEFPGGSNVYALDELEAT